MKTCEKNHPPIVFGGARCPLCDALDELAELRDGVETWRNDAKTLLNQLVELGGGES